MYVSYGRAYDMDDGCFYVRLIAYTYIALLYNGEIWKSPAVYKHKSDLHISTSNVVFIINV